MSLVIRNLVCHYGTTLALRDLTLEVAEGELLVLLGPSGSGKTTLLSLLAGILAPSEGEIRVGDQVLSRPGFVRPPEDRHIGFVFQDFALWPHMTVGETIEFPLRMRRMPREARRNRVAEVLSLVHLEPYGARYPHELSGGQRQRVAIARALAPRPSLVLLDEPMSNLDAKLREQMRIELADVLRHEGVTALYVTHDRLEALALADRIAIIDEGRLVQLAPPDTIYRTPATVFAAGFVGPAALIPARVTRAGEGWAEIACEGGLRASVPGRVHRAGAAVTWLIRPEHLRVRPDETAWGGDVVLPGRVKSSTYAGSHWQLEVELASAGVVMCHHDQPLPRGQAVQLGVNAAHTWLIDEAAAPGAEPADPGEATVGTPAAQASH